MAFKRLGIMLDMSRNAVMHVPALKQFIIELSDMGYNTLLLYTEDTYEIPGEPYFGHFRGRYSQAELKEIVDFAEAHGIEMIPCIQTLAHLNTMFRWKVYQSVRDCNDILLAEEEKTYELIGKMLDSAKECFRSPYIHIGMDEAHMVGLGKYLDKHGFQERFGILSRHLEKVCQMVAERGLKPIIWGDMYFRLKNHGVYCKTTGLEIPTVEEVAIPQDVTLTYWDYYSTEEARYQNMIHAHKQLERPVWFAGGIWTWTGFAPDNQFSLSSSLSAVRTCQAEGIENIFFTMWGDDGGECARHSVLASLYAVACFARGQQDMDAIKAAFEAKYQIPFDAFLQLDMHPERPFVNASDAVVNPERYLLFNDPFLGIFDCTLTGEEAAYYTALAQTLSGYAGHAQYGIYFHSLSLLAKVLIRKSDLGQRTRDLYGCGDREGIRQLVEEYAICTQDIAEFLRAFRTTWMAENKPFGFEVQDLRIGGLIQRMNACRERLEAWLEDGEPIPELETPALDHKGGATTFTKQPMRYTTWRQTASVNIV